MAGRRAKWRGGLVALALGTIAVVTPLGSARAAPEAPSETARQAVPEDRYALAGGCYVVRASTDRYVIRQGGAFVASAADVDDAEPFHFQATDLGQYLLYGSALDHLAVVDGDVVSSPVPDPAAEWVVDEDGPGAFTLRSAVDGALLPLGDGTFAFERVEGCAPYPEIEVNVSGPHAAGDSPFEEVRGYVDGHLHMMAYEFLGGAVHCGRPWHRYGAPYALVDCPDHEIADGAGAVLENFLSTKVPVGSHDPVGWPTFDDWPAPDSLTHEQVYYRWLERAWRGGLRMFVNLFVDNGVLCEVYPLGSNSCDEMDGVRLQAQRIRELERYIDAQSGGPGEGWFRIVTDPFEARRVINEGRLAVVLGIEVSELFGCSLVLGQPQCTSAEIDAQLDEVYDLGVRQLELVNKFDNALAGVAGDGGSTGVVVNLGNFLSTGSFWDMETCDHGHTGVHDHDQYSLATGVPEQDAIFGAIIGQVVPGGALPVYPPPHHCNTLGLSELGHEALHGIMQRHLLFDPDHMSVRARQESLDVMEMHQYPGVVSSHSWSTPDAYPRIHALGGFVTPYAGNSQSFVDAWRQNREWADDRYYWGIGWGADANGLGSQGQPRGPGNHHPVRYPFVGLGGAVVDQQRSAHRTYDINLDGVAHYGLYPDWVEDLRKLAGDEIVEDLARGSEAYLQTWERAEGVAGPGCRPAGLLDSLAPGSTPEAVLRAAGQPARREGTTFTYCVEGGGERVLEFGAAGTLGAQAQHPTGSALPATGRETTPVLLLLVGVALVVVNVARRRLT